MSRLYHYRMLFITILLLMPLATTEITNYTDAHTTTIYKGVGKLQILSIKLIHLINLEQIETELLKIKGSH